MFNWRLFPRMVALEWGGSRGCPPTNSGDVLSGGAQVGDLPPVITCCYVDIPHLQRIFPIQLFKVIYYLWLSYVLHRTKTSAKGQPVSIGPTNGSGDNCSDEESKWL